MSASTGRITLAEVQALPDILSAEHFTFNLGNIPGGFSSYQLLLKCTTVSIPGFGNEAYQVQVAGIVRNFRGRKTYPRVLGVTFVEDNTLQTLNALRAWHEYIVGSNSNVSTGNGVADYSVNATLTVYDQSGNPIDGVSFYNTFIQEVPDVQLSGEGSQLMNVTVNFHYDYPEFANTAML